MELLVNDQQNHLNAGTNHGAGSDLTRRLAEFSAAMTFDDLPREVVSKAKLCVLDTLGCCIFGASLEPLRKLTDMAASEGCVERATIFGNALRTSPGLAALVNGTSAHAFQLDEIHLESTLHPGSLALPAGFAVGEALPSVSGQDLLVAIVASYEVGIRVGLAAKGGMFKSGFHNQGTTGVFLAAAAAAHILGLNAARTQQAFGISGSQAAGLMAVQDGAMTKSFHSGRAAQSGVYAAQLAQRDYTGIPGVLDGGYGTFFNAFLDDWSVSPLTDGLGTHWHILRVGFKPAPASNGSITAMTAVDAVMREHDLQAGDIAKVTAHVSDNTMHHCGWPYEGDRIQSVLSAQMNLRYGVAVTALERCSGVAQFQDSKIRDPQILQFIERIHVAHEPKFEGENGRYRVACRLVVECINGATCEKTVLYRKGSPEDPMSENDLRGKFERLTEKIGPQKSGQLIAMVSDLENVENVKELARLAGGSE
jgi:2-methylcitrate dehydratase PrpD